LPGFKWIGNRIHELAKAGKEVIFSFEESIGKCLTADTYEVQAMFVYSLN